jgi:hypothetical protein
MRLAGHLGKTLEELGDMSLDEVRLWLAYDRVEPLGARRLEYAMAMLASMMSARWSKPGTPPRKLEDFVLFDATRQTRSALDEQLVSAFTSMPHTVQRAEDAEEGEE